MLAIALRRADEGGDSFGYGLASTPMTQLPARPISGREVSIIKCMLRLVKAVVKSEAVKEVVYKISEKPVRAPFSAGGLPSFLVFPAAGCPVRASGLPIPPVSQGPHPANFSGLRAQQPFIRACGRNLRLSGRAC